MNKTVTTLERLQLAKTRLAKPENWMQRFFTDDHGRYCLLGACDYLDGGGSVDPVLRKAIKELYGWEGTVVAFNDNIGIVSHLDILAVLDRAIELEKDNSNGRD